MNNIILIVISLMNIEPIILMIYIIFAYCLLNS